MATRTAKEQASWRVLRRRTAARNLFDRTYAPVIERMFARIQQESDERWEDLLTPLRLQRCKLNERIAIRTAPPCQCH